MYVKQLPVVPKHGGCACCPSPQQHLRMDRVIAVGFGCAQATRDGEIVYDETIAGYNDDPLLTVGDIEAMAVLEPLCDWRIVLYGPLHGEEYQRHHDTGKWTCINSNEGFA